MLNTQLSPVPLSKDTSHVSDLHCFLALTFLSVKGSCFTFWGADNVIQKQNSRADRKLIQHYLTNCDTGTYRQL